MLKNEYKVSSVSEHSAHTLQHQLVKFAIVGGSSFLINYCIRMTLQFAVPYGDGRLSDTGGRWLQVFLPIIFKRFNAPADAFFPVAAAIGGAFAIVNSFVWNRRWTFDIRGKQERTEQLRRFLLIALIGNLLDILVSTELNHAIPGDEKTGARVATIVATLLAAIWNFVGQRLYAFRANRPKASGNAP